MLVIFNDSCSKCAYFAEAAGNRNWTAVRYLHGELTREMLDAIFERYDGPVSDLVRTREPTWKALDVGLDELGPEALKDLILEYPIILQRPIVLKKDRAILARVPERVWDTFADD
ncbi:MAG: hypothetical protein JJ896_03215 [Rhodothermales bacterium]|nr:hypothetical protein [Rhodothermales bacterium]MBO6778643.1 hypothetical protein [Rhodothermales bacterium]